MLIQNHSLEIKSRESMEIVDLSDQIEDLVKNSGIKNGLVNIQTEHTTATVFLNENEPLLLKDIKNNLEQLAPRFIYYGHDDFEFRKVNMCEDEFENGHSHCKAVYLPANVILNLLDNKLKLGKWQRILFIELDRARARRINIQIMGI